MKTVAQQAHDDYYNKHKWQMAIQHGSTTAAAGTGQKSQQNQYTEGMLVPPDQIARQVLGGKRDELRRHIINQEQQIELAEKHVVALKLALHEMQRAHAEVNIAIHILTNHESNTDESTTTSPPNPTVVMAKGKL